MNSSEDVKLDVQLLEWAWETLGSGWRCRVAEMVVEDSKLQTHVEQKDWHIYNAEKRAKFLDFKIARREIEKYFKKWPMLKCKGEENNAGLIEWKKFAEKLQTNVSMMHFITQWKLQCLKR